MATMRLSPAYLVGGTEAEDQEAWTVPLGAWSGLGGGVGTCPCWNLGSSKCSFCSVIKELKKVATHTE